MHYHHANLARKNIRGLRELWKASAEAKDDIKPRMDGANYFQRVVKIIIPLNYRIILLVTLVSAIGSMLAFE
jgi:hypothetical protein